VIKAHSFYELNREYEERCSVAKAMEEINKIGREIMGRFSCGK
jgi:ribosome biogenesis protein Tsr3